MRKEYSRIPFPLIVKACDGDTEAINQILHYYRGYIAKRSLRLMKDEYGNQSMVVDEVLRGRMETRLIISLFVEVRTSFPYFPIGEVCYSIKAYCLSVCFDRLTSHLFFEN